MPSTNECVVAGQSPAARTAEAARRGVVSRLAGKVVRPAAQAAWKYRE